MPRSLKVRQDLIEATVKPALLRNGYMSQNDLADSLGISQATVSNYVNGKPVDYKYFRRICEALTLNPQEIADWGTIGEVKQKTKVFISFANVKPDAALAQALQEALKPAKYKVFTAGSASLTQQRQKVVAHIEESDCFVLILSAKSATSETVIEEVKQAFLLQENRDELRPLIYAICVDVLKDLALNKLPLSHDLRRYLRDISLWEWRSNSGTANIIQQLFSAVEEKSPPAPPLPVTAAFSPAASDPVEDIPVEDIAEQPLPAASPELPEGQVELASRLYVQRPPIEDRCFEAIAKPGALIRIKAPRQMGKTSLMARILHQAEQQGDCTVALSFELASQQSFSDPDRFMKWFCASVCRELKIPVKIQDYWEDYLDSNTNCSKYFEEYIFSQIPSSLTLGLDEVDRVFQYPDLYPDFFGLLRALHEKSKVSRLWKRLRLVVVHSTEAYIPLPVTQSPFNVGLAIDLPEFTSQQVQHLAQQHHLNWSEAEAQQLMHLIGGHPFLTRLALYHITQKDVTLAQLSTNATNPMGIFADHLRRYEIVLSRYPELAVQMQDVVNADTPIQLQIVPKYKLLAMGLVKLQADKVVPRCDLYRQYFRTYRLDTEL